jgi:tetratricopeptide (TPR) repeat protein
MSGQVSAAVNLYQKGLQIMEDCNDVGEDYTTVEIVRSDFATLLDELERCDSMQNCVHTKKVPVPHWIYICFHGCIASYIILMQTITDIRLSLDIRNEEAQELWHANIQVKEKLLGSNDPQLAVHLQSLAASYAASEKYDKCVPLLQRSLDLLLADLGPNAPELCFPLDGLATALLHLGRPSEAEPLARQALRICEAAHGSNSIATGDACHCLASIVHTLGESEEALVLIYRVLEIQERELLPGSDRFELVPTLELLIKLLESLGRWSDIPPILLKLQSLTSHLAPEHETS